MKSFYSNVVQYRGSHYQFGVWQGEQIRTTPIVSNRKRQWRLYRPRFTINVEEAKAMYQTFAPRLWEELIGLRDGLKRPMEEVLRDFGGFRQPIPRGGCSILVTSQYLLRNYDYHPKTYEGRYVLFQPTDGHYATIGPSQRIVGRMDGMNEHGLSLGYNFIHRRQPKEGFICHAIGRIVLERAKDVSEAVDLLKEIPHRHSFSYTVTDKKGHHCTVEASPRKITTHHHPYCTNHFFDQTGENRHVIDESIGRLEAIEEQWAKDMALADSFTLFNDPTKGVFVEDYRSWAGTIHTSAYIPKKLEAWISLGSQKPKRFSLKQWLQGEDLSIEKINGKINAPEDIRFIHMERT